MGLIDKIKAEVEKKTHGEQGYSSGDAEYGYRDCAKDILSFLNTLEEPEVDLEKEFDKCCENYMFDDESEVYTAKRFFKLGFKAKGEEYDRQREIRCYKSRNTQAYRC